MNQMLMPIYLTLMEKGNLAPLHFFGPKALVQL